MADSILSVFRDDNYIFGNCQVRVYDRRRVDIFGTQYLHYLYSECINSYPNSPLGTLPDTFCGMTDLSADAICAYLHTRNPLLLLCVNNGELTFDVAGFAFPTLVFGPPANEPGERCMLGGYTFFRRWWGTPESVVLGMLGLSYFFNSHPLLTAIHSQRYATNGLTARYMRQFGSEDKGTIPRFLLNSNGSNGTGTGAGKLADCVISTLLREDFERYVETVLTTMGVGRDGQG